MPDDKPTSIDSPSQDVLFEAAVDLESARKGAAPHPAQPAHRLHAPARRTPSATPPGPLPVENSPRERLAELGAQALSGAELIAVLLGGDERRALRAGESVFDRAGTLRELFAAPLCELRGIEGLGGSGARKLAAASELARRTASSRPPARPSISSPKDVYTLLAGRLSNLDREHFVAVLLDTKNRVISTETVSIGTLSSSLVHPREVFKPAIRASAAAVILAHNHPSGDARPSVEDRAVTRKLVEVGELIGIRVLDHVIFGDAHSSMKEEGLL